MQRSPARHVSSWMPAAYEDLEAADEPAELEEDAELLIEEEEDPSGWFVSQSASGPLFYWHRCSRRSLWHLPPEEEEEEEEEEEASSSNLFSLLASSPSPAVAYAGLVLLVPFLRSFPFVWRQAQAAKLSWTGMDKMDSFIARRRSGSGLCSCRQAQDARIMAGMDQKYRLCSVLELFVSW